MATSEGKSWEHISLKVDVLFYQKRVLQASQLFPVDESLVHKKRYTTAPQLDWRSEEKKVVISTPLKRAAIAHEYPMVATYNPRVSGFTVLHGWSTRYYRASLLFEKTYSKVKNI